ncbi:hypothetical protein [Hydrogenophaga sp. NFH-34]|uniref:hypothetical protein n=1 Tax=Hydrogenophaga sp. NFH-34 TaxID=2744446 RepID=UPI001F1A68EB|nr:hypothetical protein [Hydrogenophaga sp. NFH-34]
MEDLFGQQVAVFRGQPTERIVFTEEDEETVIEEVFYGGMLIEQFDSDLQKVRRLSSSGSTVINQARRDAWSGLMWCYDLWEHPAAMTFDAACAFCGADSERIRNAVSIEFADEIRLMFSVVSARLPEQAQRIQSRLSHYVTLNH